MSCGGEFPYRNASEVSFLDWCATSQKPEPVLAAAIADLQRPFGNPGRGNYDWADQATEEISAVRSKVSSFLGAHSPSEIVFTSGATESLNLVATAWGMNNLNDGDEILFSSRHHQSLVLPWIALRDLLARFGWSIRLIEYDVHPETGHVVSADILEKLSSSTRVLLLPHVHHVYGDITDFQLLKSNIPDSIKIVIDGAQSIGHISVNVSKLPCHFYAFSGHKCLALPGVGILWVSETVHEELGLGKVGGGSVEDSVGRSQVIHPQPMPARLEAGSMNWLAIRSLGTAIDYLESVGIAKIEQRVSSLTDYLIEELRKFPSIEFLPGPANCGEKGAFRSGIVSFRVQGVSSIEIGEYLAESGVFLRCGSHCTSGESDELDSVRVSVHCETERDDIDKLINALARQLGADC